MLRTFRVAALATAFFLPAVHATAQDRPVFKQPFLCAQSWDASTYDTHGPDPDSLDFFYWRERGTKAINETENLTPGQYVIASAAGTVERDDIVADDDNGQVRRIKIAHANGWATNYLHLLIEPPFLAPGRKVAMGEVIGRAGRSGTGTSNDHIHYTQRNPDNEGVRVVFDGVAADTHQGAPETWGQVLSENAERIRSANCTAAQFIRWTEGGDTYIFRYRPARRQARITRLSPDGNGGTHTWTGTSWGRSWTHFAQWRGSDGNRYLLRYSAPRNVATFMRIEPNGSGLTTLRRTETWQQRWTTITRMAHFGFVYLVTYDSVTGYQQIRIVSGGNDGAAVTHVLDDIKGWTHILPFDQNGNQFLLYYKAATGRMQIRRVRDESDPNDNGTSLGLETIFDDRRNPGWTHLTLARDGRALYLVGFRATNGRSRIWRIDAPADGPQSTARFNLNRKWDIFTAYRQDGQARLLAYGTDAGDSATFDINDGGDGLTRLTTFDWQGGWR